MQKLTKNLFLVGSFLSWDGSKLRLLYTHRFICCFCFGVFFCKHTPSVLSSWYVICGTIPSTCLKWSSRNTLIFVINKDLSFFYICHHANIKCKKIKSLCLSIPRNTYPPSYQRVIQSNFHCIYNKIIFI